MPLFFFIIPFHRAFVKAGKDKNVNILYFLLRFFKKYAKIYKNTRKGSFLMGYETTIETMEEAYSVVSNSDVKIALISIMIGCLFVAFFSFRLFKFTVVTYGVCFGFLTGLVLFGLLDIVAGLIVGVILAILFGVLSLKFCKIMIYIYGALAGAELGYTISCEILISIGQEAIGPVVGTIVGFLFAMLGSFLLYRFFKQYVIIGTSITGSLIAALALYLVVCPENVAIFDVFCILWFVLSAVSMYTQFKMCKDYELNL